MPPPGTLHGLCQVTPQLYLSNVRAASDASVLQRFNISCIINVSENKASHPFPGVDYVHIAVADSPSTTLCDHFHRVADKIDLVCRSDGRTLVHCNAGVSRSATLCIAYLMKHHNNSLLEAHGWLIDYEKELRGCTTVEMISSSIGEIPDLYEEETKNMLPF
ncbi:unnamed protein product [Boreogadus saida]